MAMFAIISQDQIIGHSELEYGDPPMGVASGRFIPAESFDAFVLAVPPNIREGNELKTWNELSAATPDGVALECAGIAVSSFDLGDEVVHEVEVLGITAMQYDELFPHHLAAYDRQFSPFPPDP